MSRGEQEGPSDGRAARRTRTTNDAVGGVPGDERPQEADGAPRRHGFRRALLLLLLLLAAGAGLLVSWALTPVSDTPDPVEFEVLPGWGARKVSSELEEQRLVRNGRLFSAYLRIRGLDRSVGEGLYDLDRSDSARELADALVRGGRPRTKEVVLPEGIRASVLVERLAAAGLADAENYLSVIEAPGDLRPPYVPEGASLEGFLFPASYEIPLSDTPEDTITRLLDRFDRELDSEVRRALDELGLGVYEWVTLASLVQSEAGSDEEMAQIAGVFLNRLDLGMALQSDPTVAYGLGKSLPELDPLAGDMRKDHPWNTYTRPGLPQGPISNPGRAALRSILSPVRSDPQGNDYLYFLHGAADGEAVFRLNTSLDGHNRDVARYLRGQ